MKRLLITLRIRYALCLATIMLIGNSRVNASLVDDSITYAQNPAPINVIEIEGGYNRDFTSGNESQGYNRICYYGTLVNNEGTPFKYAKGLDLSAPANTKATGDRNNLSLRYENGTTAIGGGLFEAIGIQPITFRGLEALKIRGTVLAAGDVHCNKIQLSVGLESPPLRIPGLHKTQATNWIVVGINANRQEATDSNTGDKNIGLITYRAFIGKAFGWRKSADVGKTTAKIISIILKQVPTYNAAIVLRDNIDTIAPNRRTNIQQLIYDAVSENESDTMWIKTVNDIALGYADAITDQPTVSLYTENSGWYSFEGLFEGRRMKNLFTTSIDYFFMPKYDYGSIRLRYENGIERAIPTARINHLMLSLNLRF